jgi:hypothetical protein
VASTDTRFVMSLAAWGTGAASRTSRPCPHQTAGETLELVLIGPSGQVCKTYLGQLKFNPVARRLGRLEVELAQEIWKLFGPSGKKTALSASTT